VIVYVDSSALVLLMKTEDRSAELSAYLDDLVDDQHLLVSSQLLEAELRPIAADPLAGLRVQRARPGARFTDVVPETGRSDETALESLLLLRGNR